MPRYSVNVSDQTSHNLQTWIGRKGLTITAGIHRAIGVWTFMLDEEAKGNRLAVVEPDGTVRKVNLLG